mgnify:CR=1 FL=1
MNNISKNRIDELISWFKDKNRVLVALSGGVDSALVAYAAHKALGDNALAVTADYKTLARDELEYAKMIAREIGIRHIIVEYNELEDANFVKNNSMRCFYCRSKLAIHLKAIAEKEQVDVIVDGTNLDDTLEYRPGLKALRDNGVRSPLLELGIGKQEVRSLAMQLGLSVHDKPSNACLASRLAYGVIVTKDRLEMVEKAESIVKSIFNVRQVRVRVHEHNGYLLARIEVGRDERKKLFDENKLDMLDSMLRSLGFTHVSIDTGGYRSGNLNIIDQNNNSKLIIN